MYRVPTIAVAYFAACVCGAVVLSLGWSLHEGSLTVVLPGVLFGLVGGAVLAFPFALPVIVLSEITGALGPKSFAIAGAAIGALLLAIFVASLRPGADIFDETVVVASLAFPSTTLAALAYWSIAWRVDPPILSK